MTGYGPPGSPPPGGGYGPPSQPPGSPGPQPGGGYPPPPQQGGGGYGPPPQGGGYSPPPQGGGYGPPPQQGQAGYGAPQGGYGPPTGGGSPGSHSGKPAFDPKTVNPLDWAILAAGLLTFIFSFINFFTYNGKGDLSSYELDQSAWSGFVTLLAILLVIVGVALVAIELFASQVTLPVPLRLAALGAFALATLLMIIALFFVPDYGGGGSGYDASVDEGHGFGYWACLILIIAATVLSFLRFQQTGGQLPGKGGSSHRSSGGPAAFGGPSGDGPSQPSGYGQQPTGYGQPGAGQGYGQPGAGAGYGQPTGYGAAGPGAAAPQGPPPSLQKPSGEPGAPDPGSSAGYGPSHPSPQGQPSPQQQPPPPQGPPPGYGQQPPPPQGPPPGYNQ